MKIADIFRKSKLRFLEAHLLTVDDVLTLSMVFERLLNSLREEANAL
jgi:hypothetical protein